jgi:hypothetical protein
MDTLLFGTRGSQVQILPLRPMLSRNQNANRHRLRHRFARPHDFEACRPDARRRERRMTESSGRAHSVPRPACGGAMLTLLRVRRGARLRRQPNLNGAFRPLRSPGSW